MPIVLHRIDDRLIHGQVVVGWGQPLGIRLLILVDDEVARSQWEQDLYRMAAPPEMEIVFESVASAVENHDAHERDPRPSIVVTADIDAMQRLASALPGIRSVCVGGLHHRAGRVQKLRYVFLDPDEESAVRGMEAAGITVTAQDVPSTHPVPLSEVLSGAAA